jgi:hypothetical protein
MAVHRLTAAHELDLEQNPASQKKCGQQRECRMANAKSVWHSRCILKRTNPQRRNKHVTNQELGSKKS